MSNDPLIINNKHFFKLHNIIFHVNAYLLVARVQNFGHEILTTKPSKSNQLWDAATYYSCYILHGNGSLTKTRSSHPKHTYVFVR